MFTVIGGQESRAGTTGFTPLAGVKDQHVRVDGDTIYIGAMNKLIGAFLAGGTKADEAYLDSPSLRRLCLLDMTPIEAAVNPTANESYMIHPMSPIALESNEGVKLYTQESDVDVEIRTGFIVIADDALAPVAGEMFTIQANATITSIVGTWVNSALTFRQTLPVGKYKLVGARCKAETGVAFRFVPIGESFRPGGLCVNAVGSKDPYVQRYGGMGEWCEFDQLTPPTVELLAGTAAAQNPEFYLDLIKV